VNRARFKKAMDRVVELLRQKEKTDQQEGLTRLVDEMTPPGSDRSAVERITVKFGERMLYLKVADIDWIEAADDVVKLHIGKQVLEHRVTLSQLEQRLPKTFARIHRSTIVNVERIREFQAWFQGDWLVILTDGTKLQSGKSYRSRIRELMGA
ncbi:MAG: LytTR family DNA-binding domain-containing protein, partial [Gemmatimonadaceae bacterium]